jgi:hypothetical protein
MSTTQIVAILVISVGLFIVGATVISALRSGSAPFGFEAGKDGVKVQTTFIGASLLAGLVLFLGAGYFFINNYEKQVEELKRKVDSLNETVANTRAVDVNARLQFPSADTVAEVKEAEIVISGTAGTLVVKYRLSDALLPNERSVFIPGLHAGDDVSIIVENGSKKFHSKQSIRIANSAFEMVSN